MAMQRRTLLGLLVLGSTAGAGLAPARADTPVAVTIDNFTFNPASVRITPGTTVTWTNRDDIPHSILCPNLNVRSHALDTGDSFSYTFTKAGTYDYLCGIHPHMRGQVVCG